MLRDEFGLPVDPNAEKTPDWIIHMPPPEGQFTTAANMKFPGMHCGWCGLTADSYPKRLDVLDTQINDHLVPFPGWVKITYLCRQCGHVSQFMEEPRTVNF